MSSISLSLLFRTHGQQILIQRELKPFAICSSFPGPVQVGAACVNVVCLIESIAISLPIDTSILATLEFHLLTLGTEFACERL